VPATGLFTYPDLSVSCPPQFLEQAHLDTLINPVLLVEVLSESTEAYDRGKKFENYRSIPSLQAYLLVAQDRMHVERYTRQGGGDWLLHEVVPGGRLRLALPCGECEIAVEDLYGRQFKI
jgi:Uma2 family endonuclease